MRARTAGVIFSVAGMICALLLTGHARAMQPEDVKGTWQSASDTASCTSPVGLCRAGVLRNPSGKQVATFYFTMDTLTPNPDGTLAFTGREVQTYDDGTMTANDEGVLVPSPTGVATAVVAIRVVGGTGAYAGATGLLDARGTLNFATDQASGTYAGTIQRSHGR